jgi:heparinase II/III-like protein
MRRKLARALRMDVDEILWRSRAASRIAVDRARMAIVPAAWNRCDLRRRLARDSNLDRARTALARREWLEAHDALRRHITDGPARFVIAPSSKREVASRIRREFPDSVIAAASRADRIVAGEYDLLGFRMLRFDSNGATDWHCDPVHDRRAPRRFWADVPYLDRECGDHKIIWELNRHQHWLALGRAFWLTGDSRYRAAWHAEFESWLADNPPLTGINWSSMLELAFRSLSWIWALYFFTDPGLDDSSPWIVDLLLGIDTQLAHVEHNLSYYFSPNTHLLGEALALYVAGRALPQLAASARRATLGRDILVREIDRQICADGGHCERSTHYHKYALDFYLLALAVARITGDDGAADFERAAARLAFAARVLSTDRGRLPHFGDDDGGTLWPLTGRDPDDVRDTLAVAAALLERPDLRLGPPTEEAFWILAHPTLAGRLPEAGSIASVIAPSSTALSATGYYVSRSAAGDHLVIDGGPHGFRNGGHAHADALSITFAHRARPLLVDPGTGCYTVDATLRDRFRSTALHNTAIVDDRPQSEPNGPFHWSSAAAAAVVRWRTNGRFDYFDGTHDGYHPMDIVHRRRVLAMHDDLLVVADLIAGAGHHATAVHWHVDPRWDVRVQGRRALFLLDGARVELFASLPLEALAADVESGLGWHSPVYGRIEPSVTLRLVQTGSTPLWVFSVFGLDADNPIVEIDTLPVWAEAGLLAQSAALRIVRAQSVDYFAVAEPASEGAPTWRVGEIETNARMLFVRSVDENHVTRVALVDGSVARTGRRGVQLHLPRHAPDLHLEIARRAEPPGSIVARLSGPGSGARLVVAGLEQPIAIERRTLPRRRAQR